MRLYHRVSGDPISAWYSTPDQVIYISVYEPLYKNEVICFFFEPHLFNSLDPIKIGKFHIHHCFRATQDQEMMQHYTVDKYTERYSKSK